MSLLSQANAFILSAQPTLKAPEFWDAPLRGSGDYKLDVGDNFSPWDIVKFGGVVAPGVALVQCRKGKRFDVKIEKGANVPTVTFVGFDLAEVIVTLRIWKQTQLNDLWLLAPTLVPPASAPNNEDPKNWPPPIDISHPSLQMLGINSVHIQHVGVLEPSGVKGVWQMRITCMEFQKPEPTKNVTTTPKGSKSVQYNNRTAINAGTQASKTPDQLMASAAADSKTPVSK